MKDLWPHLVRGGLQVLTIAAGTYLGLLLWRELESPGQHLFTSLTGYDGATTSAAASPY